MLREKAAKDSGDESESSFAKRLITGQAAENFFEKQYSQFSVFAGFAIENTTRIGCGFDFKLTQNANLDFFGVEVKGLNLASGGISLTNKEHSVAARLGDRFFLVVVRNFCDLPFCSLYRNPLNSELKFRKSEQTVIQTTWSVSV